MRFKKFDIHSLVRENIAKLKSYSSAKSEFKDFKQDLIFLDANENPYENGWNRYPDPDQADLKKILANIKGIPEENIILGNGSDEILDMILRVFCEPKKDNILINAPTFGMYKVLAGVNDVAYKTVLLTNEYQLDIDSIIKATDQNTKLLFICSPNNPTGNLIKKENILSLLLRLSNVIIIIDEAYIDFSKANSWLHEVNNYNNLIVTQTLSKAYGMAGLRLGICYAQTEIIDVLKKIKMPYNVNVLSQRKAISELKNKEKLKKQLNQIAISKELLKNELLHIPFVEKIYPSDTNFLMVKVDDANKRYKQLIQKQIVVRNRTTEPLCENCLRFTIGTEHETNELINTLKILK
ncbi:MAG: histidinol-phosphate transaminase [Flavobacteriaceae bacterium]|nr:histidinol-phosphate transaminase [Flavobacteriaceae bacterium]